MIHASSRLKQHCEGLNCALERQDGCSASNSPSGQLCSVSYKVSPSSLVLVLHPKVDSNCVVWMY